MVASLGLPFCLAAGLCLAFTPIARVVAQRTGFVDRPSARKVHNEPVPYLGGVAIGLAIVIAVVIAVASARGLMLQSLTLLVGAVALGAMGGFDDRLQLPAALRVAVEAFAAFMAVLAGVRIQLTGVEGLDIVLTMIWIIGVTNAVNLVDNMDGLASGLAALAGVGIAVIGGLQGQQVISVAGAATAGGCAAFLVFNWAPARIFMGDLGALFLGFLLAVLAIELEPAIPRLGGELVPMLLLAVPLLDTITVIVGRMGHGLSPTTGGKDHLSHRLERRFHSVPAAVGFLLFVQMMCTVLAVLAGADLVDPWLASGAAGALLVTLGALTWLMPVYSTPPGLDPYRRRRKPLVVDLGIADPKGYSA